MSSSTINTNGNIEGRIANIVADGENIRGKVAEVVTTNADRIHLDRKGFVDLTRSVVDGAIAALDKAVRRDPDSVLRQVIDGLGDGLSSTALATRLAIEEAAAEERRFEDEDLARMTGDLRAAHDLFADTITQAAGNFRRKSAAELGSLRQHAEQTMKRLSPAVGAALTAMRDHPLQLGAESVAAGVNLSRQALGSLFASIGRQLEKAGNRLGGEGAAG